MWAQYRLTSHWKRIPLLWRFHPFQLTFTLRASSTCPKMHSYVNDVSSPNPTPLTTYLFVSTQHSLQHSDFNDHLKVKALSPVRVGHRRVTAWPNGSAEGDGGGVRGAQHVQCLFSGDGLTLGCRRGARAGLAASMVAVRHGGEFVGRLHTAAPPCIRRLMRQLK